MSNRRRKRCKLQNHTRVEEGWARVLGVVGSPRGVCLVCVCVCVCVRGSLQDIPGRGRNGCVHNTLAGGVGGGGLALVLLWVCDGIMWPPSTSLPVTSGLPYFRTILAPFIPEVSGNFLLLAPSPTQIFLFFFWVWQGCWANIRRKGPVWVKLL